MNILMTIVMYGQLLLVLALYVLGMIALFTVIKLAKKAMLALDVYMKEKTVLPSEIVSSETENTEE